MKTQTILKTVFAGMAALALSAAAAANDLLLVVNKSDSTLAIVHPDTYEVLSLVETGFAPHEVYASPDGRFAYVSDYGTGPRPGNTVTVVDLDARAAAATWDLGDNLRPHGIWVSRDGSRVWVTTEGSQTVVELDAASGEMLNVWETGQNVSHMVVPTPDETKLYVANIGSGSVTVIDRRDNSVLTVPTGAGAEGIDVSPDGREVWVSNRAEHTISIIDPATDEVVETFESGGMVPIRVKFTRDGAQVFVSNALSNSVTVFDAATRELAATIDVGAVPVGVLMAPDGGRAFVANTSDNRVTVIDVAALAVTGQFETGTEPDGMDWARRGE